MWQQLVFVEIAVVFPKKDGAGIRYALMPTDGVHKGGRKVRLLPLLLLKVCQHSASKIRHGCEVQIIMLISCTYCCFKVANVVRGNTREKAMVFSSSLNLPCEISGPFFRPSQLRGILSI